MASSSSLGSLSGSKSSRTLSRNPTVDPVECQTQIKDASRRVISMDSVRGGQALLELAREHCQTFSGLLKEERELGPDRTVTIGTGCTGSAADALVFEAMEEAYREYLPDSTLFVQVQVRNKREETGMDNEIAQCFAARCITGLCLCPVYVRRRYSSGGERSLLSCAREKMRDSFGGHFLMSHIM